MNDLDFRLSKELEARHGTLVDGLSRGSPVDYPEYCKLVGEIQGIRYALNALVAIRKQLSTDDEVT